MTGIRNIGDLHQSLGNLLDRKLTAEITINCRQSETIVYLDNGELLWITNENHLLRRWQRAIDSCTKDKTTTDLLRSNTNISDYQQLVQAISSQKIELELAKNAIAKLAEECFFELMVQPNSSGELSWAINQNLNLTPYPNAALCAERVKAILLKAALSSRQWRAAELSEYLPTLSPVLQQEQKYDAMEVPLPKSYLQGDSTIWDIAAKSQIPVILLTQSLINLERQNVIKLQQIPDLPAATNVNRATSSSLSQLKSKEYDMVANNSPSKNGSNQTNNVRKTAQPAYDRSKPLIACIDDSPVLSHSVKKILSSVGYQSLIIPEPMQGMGLLVKHRPNLILLDLMMPTVNGYAVCRFLRETTLFKITPIVILTSKDSLVDRTKAKLVGASDFLSKPPVAQELLQIIRLHITDIPLG